MDIMIYTEIQKKAKALGYTVEAFCKLVPMQPSMFYRHKNRPDLIEYYHIEALTKALEKAKKKRRN